MRLMKYPDKAINMAGETDSDLLTFLCLVNDAAFYFGSETGALHIACALSIPTITILGGGAFGRFFPYGAPEKNRIAYDPEIKCKSDGWLCSVNLSQGELAPCIKNIKTEVAKQELNIIIKRIKNDLSDSR